MHQILGTSTAAPSVHRLRQSVLAIGELILASLVLPPVSIQLTGAVQHVRTARPNAVNVIAHPRRATLFKAARLLLHELLEAVAGERLVANVVRLVLFCDTLKLKSCSLESKLNQNLFAKRGQRLIISAQNCEE